MAGHSKWANIRRRKASQDAKKSKTHGRVSKEIRNAVRMGGVQNNPRLQLAIQHAKKEGFAQSKIDSAIKRASGAQAGNYQEHPFEAYAPHGVALVIETMTDNHRRTVADVRSILNKYGGKLAANNLFSRKGVFLIPTNENMDKDALMLELLEAGVDSLEEEEERLYLTCPLQLFSKIKDMLFQANISSEEASLQYVPSVETQLSPSQAERVEKLIDILEESDDVHRVYDNMVVENPEGEA